MSERERKSERERLPSERPVGFSVNGKVKKARQEKERKVEEVK